MQTLTKLLKHFCLHQHCFCTFIDNKSNLSPTPEQIPKPNDQLNLTCAGNLRFNSAVIEHSVNTFVCLQLFKKASDRSVFTSETVRGEHLPIVPSLFFFLGSCAESQLERAAFSSHWRQLKASGEGCRVIVFPQSSDRFTDTEAAAGRFTEVAACCPS